MDTTQKKYIEVGAVTGADVLSAEASIIPANYSAVNTTTGHGIMAEEALNIIDKFKGANAEIVGRSNIKNGADRLVDGIQIQTKFYNSGKGCIAACFDSESGGLYKYIDDNGTPMPVEVPKDMYFDALDEFKSRISKGLVPGVTDEVDAVNYVKQSCLTYQNAINLCLPLTRESIIYDCVTGIVTCSFALGISALFAYIVEYKNTSSKKRAAISSVKAGMRVFGLAYVAHILCSQFARTEFFKSLPNLTVGLNDDTLAASTVESINNYIRNVAGNSLTSVSGSLNQFSKLLKSGFLLSLITFAVFIVPEIISFARGKISYVRLLYNVLSIFISKVISITFFVAAAALLTDFTLFPRLVCTPICIAASCAGGLVGRKLVYNLETKTRRGANL